MIVHRYEKNPLITPADVKPSLEDYDVVCAFNAGVTRYGDETIMMIRTAEMPRQDDGYVVYPVLNSETKQIETGRIKHDDPALDLADPRIIKYKGESYLSSISHLRIARSTDGLNFTVDEKPAIQAEEFHEAFGTEDPRLTWIDGTCYITYVGVSSLGVSTCLARTKDFEHFEKMGMIFCPDNRDVVLFPEKINGKYVAYHRPAPRHLGVLAMWVGYSPDLVNWGEHKYVLPPRPIMWDSGRVGGGAPPIKTEKGWLSIYHGATPDDWYSLGALLTDLEDPSKVIARSHEPLMKPEQDYELKGFYDHVVFTCGVVDTGDILRIYYGGADTCMAVAEVNLEDLLDDLLTPR